MNEWREEILPLVIQKYGQVSVYEAVVSGYNANKFSLNTKCCDSFRKYLLSHVCYYHLLILKLTFFSTSFSTSCNHGCNPQHHSFDVTPQVPAWYDAQYQNASMNKHACSMPELPGLVEQGESMGYFEPGLVEHTFQLGEAQIKDSCT